MGTLFRTISKEVFSISTLLFVIVPFAMHMTSNAPATATIDMSALQNGAAGISRTVHGSLSTIRNTAHLGGSHKLYNASAFSGFGGHGPIYLP